jgi:hypothetical protein
MIDEFEAVQNDGLAAIAAWSFIVGYCSKNSVTPFPMVFFALPIAFHRQSVDMMHFRKITGGMHRSLLEDRTLVAGLQNRMIQMSDATFRALDLAFAAKLIDWSDTNEGFTAVRTTTPTLNDDNVKRIVATAKRLGIWMSEFSPQQAAIYWGISF